MEAAGGAAAPDGIGVHDFSGQLGEQRVHFHAMRLQDSLFLWVGATPALSSLAVAMCSPRDSVPVSTSLLGDPSDTSSVCLAQRLAPRALSLIASRPHCVVVPKLRPVLEVIAPDPITFLTAKKTKKQVFVSYNLPNTDSSFTLLIENRIKEEMMAFPEKF